MGLAIVRLGDLGDGGDGYAPRGSDSGSPNVFVNGIPIHRVGDHWPLHSNGESSHESILVHGSSTVFVNGKAIGRVGDLQSCGARAIEGSPNVFAG